MRVKDIHLENIKVVVFDFDDTLAIHTDKEYCKHRRENEDKYLNYYLNAYQYPDHFYEDIEKCSKSEVLYHFIVDLRNKGIKMYCLSGMKFSFHLKAKQSFIDKHYGNDIEIISTATQELKVDGIKIIKKINDCKLEEILFIDNRKDVVEFLNKNKINSILVGDIEK